MSGTHRVELVGGPNDGETRLIDPGVRSIAIPYRDSRHGHAHFAEYTPDDASHDVTGNPSRFLFTGEDLQLWAGQP